MTRLELTRVTVELGGAPITAGCDLMVRDGERVGLVGPNGSGKTTLLRTVFRAVDPVGGEVALDGDLVGTLSQRQIARRVALVHQEPVTDFDHTVEDIVALGRAPWQGAFDRTGPAVRAAVTEALTLVGLPGHRERPIGTLSGGEKQRVLVARAIAQESPLLLLDEPTNHLDIHAALDLLELIRALRRTTLCVLHDLNLAASYCDRLYVLDAGRVVATGAPADILTPELVRDVFRVECVRLTHPTTGKLLLAFTASP
ncbi:ABC transporter ATP-binding protein [Amycolatopsis umgeniensis]|uniref:Iron complex transport system ATP-binding protein n=1 Tax=Amycolatopsis umgeniensis TaxID=336628 RepID=A0A841BA25_9PSEU|nr:ABC transporter ATP-binding protein [Amycolatopsis umgeniensis]MBB5855725.1 iron complex transport system ATP-binding protein [Amycolatopsis umgeniensis]